MFSFSQYPFRTSRTIDGKTYIEVSELNEILDNLKELGPTLQQAADAAEKLRSAFAVEKPAADNLLLELQNAAGKLKEI